MDQDKPGVDKIFFAVLERATAEEKAAYLDEACGDAPEIRQRVERLLRAQPKVASFLESPAPGLGATDLAAPVTEAIGTMVGPYKLREQIGEGGMGVVYVAEQLEPVRRKVALKVIKPGMDTREVIARFEAERQALALMDHPNIAKVLDAGAADSGRPYFVMEFVRGIPITEYCDKARLTPRKRLELFILVCQAVQHAHQKGIIHRDLKPSNVMVTLHDGVPVPKVIDFGVAKAINQRLTDGTVYTKAAQIVGTPLYMSPEQVELSGLDIDTRTDVYSLGVMLYELLTGNTPFDKEAIRQASYDEVRRIIREEEPRKPSNLLSTLGASLTTVSEQRDTDPRKLAHTVRGDLDWIAMKALEKDRNRRYETANSFAADIQRFLSDEPIEARPPSVAYRCRKFARRNKLALSMTTLIVVAVIFGSVGTAWQAIRATRAEQDRILSERDKIHAERDRTRAERARQSETQNRIAKERALKTERAAREEWIPRIKSLVKEERRVPAIQLAQQAKQAIPNDPVLADLLDAISVTASILTGPPGVEVFIKDWRHLEDPWVSIGRTPLREAGLPVGPVRFQYRKEGFVPLESVTTLLDKKRYWSQLRREDQQPPRMVRVSGARRSPFRGNNVAFGPFLIDKYEVSNRDFQRFVDENGYENRAYWQQEFVKEGEKLSWKEAVQEFRDRTGRPGPATWRDGRYPEGKGDYPVRGVSWYEAAAYAEFAGKNLPSVHHWMAAARRQETLYIVTLSNFAGNGPAAVGTNQGVGFFGAYDMAGNVKEWSFNATSDGKRWILGGAWNEPTYMFGLPESAAPFSRQETFGFRCVRYPKEPPPDTFDATELDIRDYSLETPATAEEVKGYLRLYMYDAKLPLEPKPVSVDDSKEGYRHEIVQINAAYGNERFNLHLFVPKTATPPYQAVIYFPGVGTQNTKRPGGFGMRYAIEIAQRGSLVCWPVYQGTFERRDGYSWKFPAIQRRDYKVQLVKDLARSIDYLETRADINTDKLAYLGFSWGAALGPLMAVVEPRIDTCVLISGGLEPRKKVPETDPFNYLPHVKIPVLMINGRYDDYFRIEELQMPMFEGLGSTEKNIIHFDVSHVVPTEAALPHVHDWLEKHLGPARETETDPQH